MDVDGTLTDGSIYVGGDGEVMKRFYVRDGLAIKHILPKHGIRPIILTGRSSDIVEYRCRELDIDTVIQGSGNKLPDLLKTLCELGIEPCEAAYIGDDINDIECMRVVGLSGCPADAAKQVRSVADFVSAYDGGRGAVREFIEWILNDEKNTDS